MANCLHEEFDELAEIWIIKAKYLSQKTFFSFGDLTIIFSEMIKKLQLSYTRIHALVTVNQELINKAKAT